PTKRNGGPRRAGDGVRNHSPIGCRRTAAHPARDPRSRGFKVMEFLQFAVLGLGAGGAYAIAGIGLTQVYRGSGVLNLAHGAMAFFSAVLFVWANQRWHLPFGVAALIAVVAAGLIGALVELLVMRNLRDAAPLVRIIATLGVMAILQQAVPLIFGADFQNQNVQSYYPSGALNLGGSVSLTYDRLIVVVVTLVL